MTACILAFSSELQLIQRDDAEALIAQTSSLHGNVEGKYLVEVGNIYSD
jgi:hypothetical protein